MQFQVPQFIEREAQVVGPLTFRQFAFLAAAGAVAFILYFLVPFIVFVAASVVLAGVGLITAFVQVGGKSLPALLMDFLSFQMGGKIYYWKKKRVFASAPVQPTAQEVAQTNPAQITLSKESKVGRLSTKIEAS
ncbi:MAG: PrgI family protein [Parcubacteria group bacterium]|nr:PrgI family protein [Parcubacteria group bacterium]